MVGDGGLAPAAACAEDEEAATAATAAADIMDEEAAAASIDEDEVLASAARDELAAADEEAAAAAEEEEAIKSKAVRLARCFLPEASALGFIIVDLAGLMVLEVDAGVCTVTIVVRLDAELGCAHVSFPALSSSSLFCT